MVGGCFCCDGCSSCCCFSYRCCCFCCYSCMCNLLVLLVFADDFAAAFSNVKFQAVLSFAAVAVAIAFVGIMFPFSSIGAYSHFLKTGTQSTSAWRATRSPTAKWPNPWRRPASRTRSSSCGRRTEDTDRPRTRPWRPSPEKTYVQKNRIPLFFSIIMIVVIISDLGQDQCCRAVQRRLPGAEELH